MHAVSVEKCAYVQMHSVRLATMQTPLVNIFTYMLSRKHVYKPNVESDEISLIFTLFHVPLFTSMKMMARMMKEKMQEK